jgi:polyisoprenoid-binding protein YceI
MTIHASDFTRVVGDRTVPEPGTYAIDPSHSGVEFVTTHMMVSKVRGRFASFGGSFTVGERPKDSAATVTIQADSIDTGEPQRDGHLRTADFLDVDNFPTLRFQSAEVVPGGEEWQLRGDLTIRDVTRSVTLDLSFLGATPDIFGDTSKPRVGFTARTRINREDFGLTWNQALEAGGWLVGKNVDIEINVEAVRQ